MKGISAFLFAAVLFVLVGMASLTAARLQRHMADAQEQVATLQYAEAQGSLDAAEGYLEYARWVPGVGDRSLQEVRARKAALLYWQGKYEAVLPAQAEPVAAVDEANADLQLVVANAAFRVGLTRAKERTEIIQALTEAANGYAIVLKNDTWNEDAAHNYEYIVRLRDLVAKGQRPPMPQEEESADLGQSGEPSPATTGEGFEIYIPLEGSERSPSTGEAGKAGPNQRKG